MPWHLPTVNVEPIDWGYDRIPVFSVHVVLFGVAVTKSKTNGWWIPGVVAWFYRVSRKVRRP